MIDPVKQPIAALVERWRNIDNAVWKEASSQLEAAIVAQVDLYAPVRMTERKPPEPGQYLVYVPSYEYASGWTWTVDDWDGERFRWAVDEDVAYWVVAPPDPSIANLQGKEGPEPR